MKKQRKIRPHIWITGPDPERHDNYCAWLQQRNQAQFRGEGWDLSFDDWLAVWGDDIKLRGRLKEHKCMTRNDYEEPWSRDNAVIIPRSDYYKHIRARGIEVTRTRKSS